MDLGGHSMGTEVNVGYQMDKPSILKHQQNGAPSNFKQRNDLPENIVFLTIYLNLLYGLALILFVITYQRGVINCL